MRSFAVSARAICEIGSRAARPVLVMVAAGAAAWLLGGCAATGYYAQAARGQVGIMAAARPIPAVLDDPATPADLRVKLAAIASIKRFAESALALPETGSYDNYVQLDRAAMVWSVVAAPVDSVEAKEWCYPVIGCASYRGYFDRQAAEAYADGLRGEGWDVAVEPVPAYSTLGWFDDPLPSTVTAWPLSRIAGLIFHELAHVALYVPGDSDFNEAYATLVEHEGVDRWLRQRGTPAQRAERTAWVTRRRAFVELLADARARLAALYARPGGARAEMLAGKDAVFDGLRRDYDALKSEWQGYTGFDRWFDRPLNNAHLAGVGIYYGLEPAFRELLREVGGDMRRFHAASRALGELDVVARRRRMQALLERDSRVSGR
jgi:predicted aminopeptidase